MCDDIGCASECVLFVHILVYGRPLIAVSRNNREKISEFIEKIGNSDVFL